MGLDMYLDKQYYIRNWEHTPVERRFSITIQQGNKPYPILLDKIKYVTTEEICWRKANAIHRWFVEEVQDGMDNCETYDVSPEQLKQLLDLVTQVLADHSKASELLPTQEGFFFGNTEFDKYYYEDLEFTKRELERVLAKEDDGYFQYHSSW